MAEVGLKMRLIVRSICGALLVTSIGALSLWVSLDQKSRSRNPPVFTPSADTTECRAAKLDVINAEKAEEKAREDFKKQTNERPGSTEQKRAHDRWEDAKAATRAAKEKEKRVCPQEEKDCPPKGGYGEQPGRPPCGCNCGHRP